MTATVTKEPVGKLAPPGLWQKEVEPAGKLHGPGALFMGTSAGTATVEHDDGSKDELELLCGGWGAGPPMIRCKRTGLTYSLDWREVLKLAIDAGVTKQHPDMEGM